MKYNMADFINICVKKDDEECKSFLGVCSQCPASHYNISITLNLLLLVMLVLEVQFKLITKILENCKTKTRKITKFYVTGITNPIELEIGKNNNIVQVKRQICSAIKNCDPDLYKIMKLSLNGERINDKSYFPYLDLSKEDKIICEVDKKADPNEIVVIQLQDNVELPKCIQIEKYQTISQLKTVIPRIDNIQNCKIFINNKENENKFQKVDDDATLTECELHDDDVIRVILQKTENLEITSIFNEKISIKIKYSNVDLVYFLKKIVAANLEIDQNELVLFLYNKTLNLEKYAFEYLTETNLPVKFCKFKNSNDLDIDNQPLVKGNFGELFKTKMKENNMEILIKRYNLTVTTQIEDNSHIFDELKKFQLTKSHPSFIQILGLYKDDYYVYIAMENMEIGSLSVYLKKYSTISEDCVAGWSLQILEGLKFLHQNEIIHRDLNPKSVLLDKDLSIKLSNFNLSKYTNFHNCQTYNEKYKQKSAVPLRYLAPETVINEEYSCSTDVWSFGAVLIRIVTNKRPYCDIAKNQIRNEIIKNRFSDYKCPDNVHVEIKKIIELCMKANPYKRPAIKYILGEMYFQQAEMMKIY